ncbi:pyrroloquinoline quinone biosynthesis protein PqqB [Azospirillum sp. SYSU D00513]|uniref:pyrroloquinoline quinone biosynthesis protein PqqB n=1 Tax=Azospirillum sp. SYSU D00513 TaxID=2812561 RepID=UPI001A9643EF|nr:pyrroloquinoline quinone biosynthesis protein PqqB [Azospirillum sp. SYSU D00513]
MQIIVLGSAAGGGFPQWNCNCEGCRRARSGDPLARPRTQSSLAVSADGRRWLLLNASPDLRAQILATPALHAVGERRGTPISAALLTNADIDHVTGLLTLRESQPFALYATARVQGVLAANSVFQVLKPEMVPRRAMALGTPFQPAGPDGEGLGLEVEVFAIPGKVALYLEDESIGLNLGAVSEDTVAVRITDTAGGGSFFYMPGCASLPGWLADRLRGAPLVFFDGTTWVDDEMARTGTGVKTAQRMGHMAISGPDGSLAAFDGLGVARKVYIHLNNTNPVLLEDSAERRQVEAAGWEVAHDGMEFSV